MRNKKKNGVTYIVYKFDVEYNPDTKMNDSSRVGIGKMCDGGETMTYPNKEFQKYFPGVPILCIVKPKTDPVMHIGSFLVPQKIITDDHKLTDILKPIPGDRTGFFLDISMYMVIKFSNVMQFYTDYAHCHPLMTAGRKMYGDSAVSDYFKDLGAEDSLSNPKTLETRRWIKVRGCTVHSLRFDEQEVSGGRHRHRGIRGKPQVGRGPDIQPVYQIRPHHRGTAIL